MMWFCNNATIVGGSGQPQRNLQPAKYLAASLDHQADSVDQLFMQYPLSLVVRRLIAQALGREGPHDMN